MAKQTRLGAQKQKTGRRVVVFILIIVATSVAWYLDKEYEIVKYLKEIQTTLTGSISDINPVRGTVYDRNLKQLAVTMERVSVYVRTREIRSIPETVQLLGSVLSLDEQKLQDQLESGPLRIWIAEDITQQQEVLLKEKKMPGVYLQKNQRRFYPNGFHAAHIIGYVENNIGLAGVEYYFDRLLANRQVERNSEKHSADLTDLALTIDLKIQVILEDLVNKIGAAYGAVRVASYIMDSRTGEVVAGAQLPGFDPNSFTGYSKKVLENFFLVPLLIPDKFRLFLRDAALLNANKQAGIAYTSWSLSPQDLNLGGQLRLWEKLDLNKRLELDFGSFESEADTWKNREVRVLPEKQLFGLAPEYATPLNLLTAFAFLLNGGRPVHPFVVKKEATDGVKRDTLPQDEQYDLNRFFGSQANKTTSGSEYFQDEIQVYTSPSNQISKYTMMFTRIPAGTSELFMLTVAESILTGPHKKGEKTMIPMEQIVDKRIERISVLQQVAKSVADVVEPELRGEANYPLKEDVIASYFGEDPHRENTIQLFGVMPDLQGLSLRKSLRMLQGVRIKITFRGTGKVVLQTPNPGTPLRNISECELILERSEDMEFEKISHDLTKEN